MTMTDEDVQNTPLPLPPLARKDDPWTSQLGAIRIEPTRASKKGKVLEALRCADGGWVPGFEFQRPEIGGSEALRRMRELRAEGHNIERKAAAGTSWLYRLVEDVPEDAPYGTL